MGARTRVLFLDASDDVLVRRYEATRRTHPLAADDRVSDGIAQRTRAARRAQGRSRRRRRHVRPQRARAARPAARAVRRRTTPRRRAADQHRVVRLQARAADRRRPRVRLPLPAQPALGRGAAPAPGTDPPVRDVRARAARDRCRSSTSSSGCSRCCCPAYVREGKAYLSIGVGCTGGRHRSVVIAAELARAARAARLSRRSVHNRDVDRG